MNIKKYITSFVFALIFVLGLAFSPTDASAAIVDLSGHAWSGNVGWISFNCADTNSCATSNYKVTWNDVTGALSGYAWNDNIGWINFDSSLSSCPNGNTIATCAPGVVTVSGVSRLKGYARAIGGNGVANTWVANDTWSGFIDLSGVSVRAVSNPPTPRPISGYAWGSDIIGWIDMSGVQLAAAPNAAVMNISLSANREVVSESSNQIVLSFSHSVNSTLTIAPTSCIASKTVNGVSQPAQAGWGGSIALRTSGGIYNFYPTVGLSDAVYSVVCSNGANVKTASVQIKVAPSVVFNADKNNVSYVVSPSVLPNPVNINSLNAVRFSWSTRNATSCNISNTGGNSNASGSLWSGPASPNVSSGTRDLYVGQYSNTYSMTCVNANNGLSTTVSQPVKVWNFMDDILPNPASVSFPSPNASNINFYTHKRNGTYDTNGIGNVGPAVPTSSVRMNNPTTTREFYQSFIAHETGPLQQIHLYYTANTVGYKPYDLLIRIHSDNNGTPSFSPISASNANNPVFPNPGFVWPANAHTTYNWGSVNISGINVEKGKRYWIKFTAPPSQWNHLDLASTSGGDLRTGNRTSSYSPASSLYYKIFINSTNPNQFSGNLVACNASKTVNGVVQPAGDGWVAPVMSEDNNPNGGLAFYNKTFSVGNRTAVYKVDCFNRLLPVETKSSTAVIPVSSSVNSVAITSFTASPASFSASSGNTTLSWTSTPAGNSCSLNRATPLPQVSLGNNLPASSSVPGVPVSSNSNYTITCTDGINFASRSLSVNVGVVPAPAINSFQASPNPVSTANRNSNLSWTVSNVNAGCDLYSSPSPLTASQPVWSKVGGANAPRRTALNLGVSVPTADTVQSYMLQCFNTAGDSDTRVLQLNVTPPMPSVVINNFNANPLRVLRGTGITNLSWNVSHATSCTASKSGGASGQPWSGVVNNSSVNVPNRVGNSDATYTLSCSNPDSVTPVSRSVTVEAVAATSLYDVELDFSAVPSNVSSSENNTELRWVVRYANSCTASKIAGDPDSVWSGTVASSDGSHSRQVSVGATDSTYRLVCTNNISSEDREITVSVDPLTKKIRVIER
jgi:hypothetical protein